MKSFHIIALLSLVLGTSTTTTLVAAADDGKCASTSKYQCPSDICTENGFIEVSDCQSCEGHFSTDANLGVCFDRKLLNATENPSSDYLWRDILGMIIWFITAGLATASGVGGGGIYVPVGILLLKFAPKPSSGLSQASIFGASLGGLLLNIKNHHPFVTRRNKTTKSCESVSETDVPDDDTDDNNEYYTRPLIDFDMALFLAPMEMSGAVLGVIIQKLLPK
jgi:hypothetical protein